MALMDRDNLCGAPRFYMAAKKIGAKAHIGAEITGDDGDFYPLLVENRTGYQNLCRLITSMKLRAPKGEAAASQDELRQYSAGLVCLTGESPPTRARFEKLKSIFGEKNVYAELQRHLHRDEEARNQAVIDLARSSQTSPSSPPTASATRPEKSANSSMSSPPSATKRRSLKPAVCSPEIPNAT